MKYMLKNKELEEILEKIDLNEAPPAEEPMRQYYFMKKAQMLVKQKSEELGLSFNLSRNDFWVSDECARL